MFKVPGVLFIVILFFQCSSGDEEELRLANYMCNNMDLERGVNVIACAGGKIGGLDGLGGAPTSVFYYPIEGAKNVKYFEARSIFDSLNYLNYFEKSLDISPVFNGYLEKFSLPQFSGERFCVVTFETEGKIHVSDPIKIKTNTLPTEVNPELIEVQENSITPSFNWSVGDINENVIYFQVISELDGDLISGTYTTDQNFTFYDLENVVLNVSPENPEIEPNSEYKFSLMGVSEDNWINMLSEKTFSTAE